MPCSYVITMGGDGESRDGRGLVSATMTNAGVSCGGFSCRPTLSRLGSCQAPVLTLTCRGYRSLFITVSKVCQER